MNVKDVVVTSSLAYCSILSQPPLHRNTTFFALRSRALRTVAWTTIEDLFGNQRQRSAPAPHVQHGFSSLKLSQVGNRVPKFLFMASRKHPQDQVIHPGPADHGSSRPGGRRFAFTARPEERHRSYSLFTNPLMMARAPAEKPPAANSC